MKIRAHIGKAAFAACVMATATSLMAASPASAYIVNTPYDTQVLSQYPWPISGYPTVSGKYLSDYCEKVGFGYPYGTGKCQLLGFYEENRPEYVPNYMRQASEVLFNCTSNLAQQAIGWSFTRTATNTVGASVSVAVSVNYGVKPFGVGVEGSVTTTVAANYSYAWGTASTQSGTTTLNVSPGYVGWFDYGTFHGTAHGVADVYIEDTYTSDAHIRRGVYKVVTDIKGDLPKPENPAAVAVQPATGLIAQQRPMTATEKTMCMSSPTVQQRAVAGGTPTQSRVVSP
ncbi:ETX/MTX2 family pore-forming toxin (plasmid) [Streptomyces sp. CA-142005]|uniref:ETX/MTX2 family pore-forming toxin n=1 Tax=Streptomyces sp. CA-142005 TaxID=3240052 RepID=UPI003D8F8E4E